MLEAPEDRLLGGFPRLGVISQDGDGLALLAGGARMITRLESYGDADAELLLLELGEGWKQRGRPSWEHLRIEVTFREGAGSGVDLSWGR
jgi:hypothetical protein